MISLDNAASDARRFIKSSAAPISLVSFRLSLQPATSDCRPLEKWFHSRSESRLSFASIAIDDRGCEFTSILRREFVNSLRRIMAHLIRLNISSLRKIYVCTRGLFGVVSFQLKLRHKWVSKFTDMSDITLSRHWSASDPRNLSFFVSIVIIWIIFLQVNLTWTVWDCCIVEWTEYGEIFINICKYYGEIPILTIYSGSQQTGSLNSICDFSH